MRDTKSVIVAVSVLAFAACGGSTTPSSDEGAQPVAPTNPSSAPSKADGTHTDWIPPAGFTKRDLGKFGISTTLYLPQGEFRSPSFSGEFNGRASFFNPTKPDEAFDMSVSALDESMLSPPPNELNPVLTMSELAKQRSSSDAIQIQEFVVKKEMGSSYTLLWRFKERPNEVGGEILNFEGGLRCQISSAAEPVARQLAEACENATKTTN